MAPKFYIKLSAFYIVILLASCKSKVAVKEELVPEVHIVEAGQKSIPLYVEYVGQVYGQSDVEIKPRVEGWVKSLHFK